MTETLLIVLLIGTTLVAYGLIDNRWYRILSVEGASMSPAFEPGDAIVITPPPDVIEVGMVLTLRMDDELMTHRVIEVLGDGSFVTKGDASNAPDSLDRRNVQVVGRQRFSIPGLGSLLEALVQAGHPGD